MLYKLLKFLELWLPYRLLLLLYSRNKALPITLRTKSGRALKAIMLTDRYGILFTMEHYNKNRIKKLREQQLKLQELSNAVLEEINLLSTEARESLFDED